MSDRDGKIKHFLWMEEEWTSCEMKDSSRIDDLLESMYNDRTGRFTWKGALSQSAVGDASRVFQNRIHNDDSEIFRIGIRSDCMFVGDQPVLLFVEEEVEKGLHRMGVQMNYDFTPDYFLQTTNVGLAYTSLVLMHECHLNYESWLEAMDSYIEVLE